MAPQFCKSCKSLNCTNPEHVKVAKAFVPEDDKDLSKVTKQMSKNLISQLEDKESLHKALTSIAAASLGREQTMAKFRGFVNPDVKAPRHLGEAVARAVHVEPPPAVFAGSEYGSCNNCGTVIKSLQECPRCTANAKIVEAKDWRSGR
jgi:hypothetical protein